MKTEYKKVNELLASEDAEVLKEFEMVELQGGKDFLTCNNTIRNLICPIKNDSSCLVDCFIGNKCEIKP